MRRLFLLAAAAVLAAAVLALPAVTSARRGSDDTATAASKRDRNRDRLPDRWERRHRLSLRVKQTKRDQDRDGLNNLGEFRAGLDPRDADTDGDGKQDGAEHAGTIESFDGATLVIRLAGGGGVTGTVDADTQIKCDAGTSGKASHDESGADRGGERGKGDDDQGEATEPDGRQNDDHGDDENEDGGGGTACTTADLKTGATVHEADLKAKASGLVYREIELAGPAA